MSDRSQANAPDQAEHAGPKLRCLACGFMTPLPAENCARCGADLRTGYVKESEPEAHWIARLILGGLVLAVIIALGVFFLVLEDGQPEVGAQEAPNLGGMSETLETFEGLAGGPGSPGVDPAKILNQAREAADKLEEHGNMAGEVAGQ